MRPVIHDLDAGHSAAVFACAKPRHWQKCVVVIEHAFFTRMLYAWALNGTGAKVFVLVANDRRPQEALEGEEAAHGRNNAGNVWPDVAKLV